MQTPNARATALSQQPDWAVESAIPWIVKIQSSASRLCVCICICIYTYTLRIYSFEHAQTCYMYLHV